MNPAWFNGDTRLDHISLEEIMKTGSLYILFFCTLLLAPLSWADTRPYAEVTTRVNLRCSPSLESKIITSLEKGERIKVMETKQGWCLVAYENENFGYKGWVYERYLNLSPPAPISTMENPGSDPATAKTDTYRAANLIEPAPGAPDKVRLPEPAETVPVQSPSVEKTDINSIPQKEISGIGNGRRQDQKTHPQYPAWRFADRAQSKQPPFRPTPQSLLFQLALRFSTVLMSCMALIFSYWALHMTRQSNEN